MTERDANNRKIAAWLFGKSLDGFGIFSASGARIRERDFDSIKEAQRYIDSEDERVPEAHKAATKGVNIQPCIKAHPNFYTSETASGMLLDALLEAGFRLRYEPIKRHHSGLFDSPACYVLCRDGGYDMQTHADRKTAIVLATLAFIDSGGNNAR